MYIHLYDQKNYCGTEIAAACADSPPSRRNASGPRASCNAACARAQRGIASFSLSLPVTVRLSGVATDTQTGIATGGDAAGDTLVGIEGLIGSRFNDTLTGNALNNVLAGGFGSDVLDEFCHPLILQRIDHAPNCT